MSTKSKLLRKQDREVMAELSRRAFVRNTSLAAGAMASMAVFTAPMAQADEAGGASRIVDELPIPVATPPEKTEYECEVLVIGAGWSGISAAIKAKELGCDVLVVDKGTPGYSGLMPWSHTYRWVDLEAGEDRDLLTSIVPKNSEFSANPEQYGIFADRSKEVADAHEEWGFLNQWEDPDMSITQNENKIKNPTHDRHYYFAKALPDHDVPVLARTMVVDLLENDGRVVGAVAMDVETATPITIKCKAAIMCMGAGSIKPTGFPTGTNTFDGEAIAYRHGMTIIGKEYPDHHGSNSYAPGSTFTNWGWPYLEGELCTCGVPTGETIPLAVLSVFQNGTLKIPDGTMGMVPPEGMYGTAAAGLPDDGRRIGAHTTIPQGVQNAAGGCIGMSVHKTEGIHCGWDHLDGQTPLAGVWCCGDTYASMAAGAVYIVGPGFSSNMSGVEGFEAAEGAAAYVKTVEQGELPVEAVEANAAHIASFIEAPAGFDPNWARDVLHAAMAPYWVSFAKDEASLTGALNTVIYMRDNIIPRLAADNAHEQRLCLEMENKILSAEMTLRGSLERRESRGMHYRTDYPYRDDENFLCHFGYRMAEDGSMEVVRVEIPDEWKGDPNEPYQQRYPMRFPGETEALGLDPANEPGQGDAVDWSENAQGNTDDEQ